MHSILFSCLAAFVNMALLYWLSPVAAMLAFMVEMVALFCVVTNHRQWLLVCIAYVISSLWVLVHFLAAMSQQIPLSWQNQKVRLEGRIVSMVATDGVKQQFTLKATRLCLRDRCVTMHAKIELNAYLNSIKIPFAPNQSWILYVRLKRLHRLANPNLLQPIEWAKGEYAVGSVLNKPSPYLMKAAPRLSVNGLRQSLAQRLSSAGLNDHSLAVILALTLGDRSHLSSSLWLLFQRTGVLHLMAISGLHVGLVATFVYGGIFLLLWPFPKCFHYLPRQKIAMWVAVSIAWGYGALAGFAVSTVRACIMLSIYVIAKSLSRSVSWTSVLLWSSVCILMCAPLESMDMSFWLSFIAVSWIAFLIWVLPKRRNTMKQHIVMQVALSACLLPLSLLFFQKSPLNAPLANLIAVPWVSFLVLPGALLAEILQTFSPMIAHPIFIIVQWNVDQLLYFLQTMVQWLPQQWWSQASGMGLGLMCAGLLLGLLPRAWQLKGIAIVWLLLSIYIPWIMQPHSLLRATVLDVGQGLAVVVQTRHHTLLYDTGPSYYGGGDAASIAIVPFLKQQSRADIDMLMVSHQDADHSGGVPTLLMQLPVTTLITSASRSPFVRQLSVHSPFEHLHLSQCQQGQHWYWDGVDFRVLSPSTRAVDIRDNNLSCVLAVTVSGHRLLLTGDIEQKVEQALLRSQAAYLPADILVAPHHGSLTSSSADFIAMVHPKIVIFSTGYLNRYHFPSKNVQKRYQSQGVLTYNTADNGAVSFAVDEQGNLSSIVVVRKVIPWQNFLERVYQEQHENNT